MVADLIIYVLQIEHTGSDFSSVMMIEEYFLPRLKHILVTLCMDYTRLFSHQFALYRLAIVDNS